MDKIVYTTKPSKDSLPGFYEPDNSIQLSPSLNILALNGIDKDDAFIIENALSSIECDKLIDFMYTSDNFEEVGVQGMKDKKDEHIGSLRTSIWDPNLSEQIWQRIYKLLPNVISHEYKATDWWQGLQQEFLFNSLISYKPVAVSPLLRFMQYNNGGEHFSHYDAGFIYPNKKYRTLKSMVIYLTTNNGAATRFIKDDQHDTRIWNRNHDDWNRPVNNDEIIAKSECIQGNILIFDHRLCHDVEKYMGDDPRIIIRGDIVYKLNTNVYE